MPERQFVVYMVTNDNDSVLYIGVTSDLTRRLDEHRQKQTDGFTKRYGMSKPVYFEVADNADAAIAREKQLKRWSRAKKETLIERLNPRWNDLSETLFGSD